jgi:hypothetical protein
VEYSLFLSVVYDKLLLEKEQEKQEQNEDILIIEDEILFQH